MKNLKMFLLSLLLVGSSLSASAQNTPWEQLSTNLFTTDQSNYQNPSGPGTYKIDMTFAEAPAAAFNADIHQDIKEGKTFVVELIYTRFARSDQFNQAALNKARLEQLLTQYPALKNAAIQWRSIEVFGSTSVEDAKQVFHGFVLYAKDQLETNQRVEPIAWLQPQTERIVINNKRDTIVKVGQGGTQLHVPAHCFTTLSGEQVTGDVEISFKEFRNAADMAFSGIIMTHTEGDETYQFSSSGMFEINGSANGEQIRVKPGKALAVDYDLAYENDSLDFYKMKPDTSGWVKQQAIATAAEQNMQFVADQEAEQDLGELVVKENFRGKVENWIAERLIKKWPMDTFDVDEPFIIGEGGTLLAEGADVGHTYPDIVKGLNVPSFGVYNCDQIYRLKQQVSVSARYLDEDGKLIRNGKVLSMVDLDYNGAFSFDPRQFICSQEGNNVLLLFTADKRMFLLEKGQFQKQYDPTKKETVFTMKEVTNTIKSSDDLAAYLGVDLSK